MPARDHLVVVRSGRQSFHNTWLGNDADRTWDMFICPYEPGVPEPAAKVGVTVGRVVPGHKWVGIRSLFQDRIVDFQKYDYVWFPDDDLFMSQNDIDVMFKAAKQLNAKLCSPALHERSYFTHPITMKNRSFLARRTDFVEIMMPCFRKDALDLVQNTLDRSPSGYGWGLEWYWSYLMEDKDIYIIDAVSALHTRPVHKQPPAAVWDEMRAILNSIGRAQHWHVLAGYDVAGGRLSREDPKFLFRLLKGWEYLFETNPSLLLRVLREQGIIPA